MSSGDPSKYEGTMTVLAELEHPAEKPTIRYGSKLPDTHWVHDVHFATAVAEELLERRGIAAPNLSHTALMFYDSTEESVSIKHEGKGSTVDAKSYILTSDAFSFGTKEQYGPFIVMDVSGKSIEALNHDLRHELSHLGDPIKEQQPYQSAKVLKTAKQAGLFATILGGGAAGLAGLDILLTSQEMNSANTITGIAGAALLGMGIKLLRNSDRLVHALTPAEIRANRFARKYQDLNPLAIGQ